MENLNNNSNIQNYSLLYNDKINEKDKEIEILKRQIKLSQEKINRIKIENEVIKELNYNYKMTHLNNMNLIPKIETKNETNNKFIKRDKYLSTIEEDNQNCIKNELLEKISNFYNNIYKMMNNSNNNIINEFNDFDNINNLIELEKKFQFIEDNIFLNNSINK